MTYERRIKVGMSQINNGFSGQYYLPYSTALLQSYAQKNTKDPNRYEFLLPLYKRIHIDDALKQFFSVDVAAFSTYVWNEQISLAIAKRLKKENPDTFIIFGGPQVPDSCENFLRKHSFIDVACHQEGERTFLQLLENFPNNDFSKIDGISFITNDNFFHKPSLKRMTEFSQVPSPFLSGTFDNLMEANPNEHWLASWETNRGCPFSCTYCDWGSATNSKVAKMEMDRVKAELDWFSQKKIEFVFCCDANFGMLPRDIEIAKHAANNKKIYGYPHVLSVQNTKNARERAYEAQKILVDSGLSKGVTLAMQSVDANTLKQIKRDNISLDVYRTLQDRFAKDNVPTYTEFILSLPGDTYDSFATGVSDVISSGQHNRIQYNILSILPNSEMALPEYREKYGLETIFTPIVNNHGSLDICEDDIYESQELVIATSSLTKADWIKVRTYASMSEILHFNKLLQIPLILINQKLSISFRTMFEIFIDADKNKYPLLAKMSAFFSDHAKSIQKGGAEYIHSKEWLDLYWPPGEFFYITMSVNNELDAFFKEAAELLKSLTDDAHMQEMIEESVLLNYSLLKQPLKTEDLTYRLTWDIPNFYKNALEGNNPDIKKIPQNYTISRNQDTTNNWLDWMQKVVWYGHRRGAYLYGIESMKNDLAGHY
jgi:radical SAM superfamily enzyme YgiQ (UPF0313 family)